ncbi:pentatricopeptide repeat-containing protein PNM1, mitochondrial [Lolium rigidum]|uniref:pentatricopeptide repeat-containing protein PNM1, mitochondrial n=1 Tax=Lolium rigidum TaxID=89674 RepID=UPI001F5D32E7|nr:pentatricopeptide repeat-containing protein PNM1, mitochondrial [Lolium rigidum]
MWSRHLLRRLLPSPATAGAPSPLIRHLSTTAAPATDITSIASSLAAAVTKLSSTPPPATSPEAYFSLHFSDVRPTTALLAETLSLSPPATSRAAADLFRFLVRRSLHPSDGALALVVRHLARRRDFPAVRTLLQEFPSALGPDTLKAYLFHLARAGRATDALKVFDELPVQLRTREALTSLVASLSSEGFPQLAERAVKKVAHEIFPDDNICTLLVSGYADAGKLDHALRLIGETRNGGFQPGLDAYNAVLDCVCRLCRKKDPLRMPAEAEKFLIDMEANGIPRDAGTFRVLIKNLCKIRRTEDAMNLFRRMGEWGCSPDADTYLILIKSLYQAARISEGDEMVTWMRSAGFGDKLDRKAYYGFIKVLCGIERVEHAIKVFRMMKGYGHAPGTKSYSLLIEKLATHNLGDRSNALFREAVARGVTVTQGVYKIDKRYVKEKKEKVVKKRLTLPEKKILKSKRLYKLKMSFVKKPRRRMRA